jgi:hypothetical protein
MAAVWSPTAFADRLGGFGLYSGPLGAAWRWIREMDLRPVLDSIQCPFDARNNVPRVGRVVVGRGRDAIDVALITTYGHATLSSFEVVAENSPA